MTMYDKQYDMKRYKCSFKMKLVRNLNYINFLKNRKLEAKL